MTTEQEIWLRAWLAVAASSNCKTTDVCTDWANRCLRDFKAKFPSAPIGETR